MLLASTQRAMDGHRAAGCRCASAWLQRSPAPGHLPASPPWASSPPCLHHVTMIARHQIHTCKSVACASAGAGRRPWVPGADACQRSAMSSCARQQRPFMVRGSHAVPHKTALPQSQPLPLTPGGHFLAAASATVAGGSRNWGRRAAGGVGRSSTATSRRRFTQNLCDKCELCQEARCQMHRRHKNGLRQVPQGVCAAAPPPPAAAASLRTCVSSQLCQWPAVLLGCLASSRLHCCMEPPNPYAEAPPPLVASFA